LRSGVAFCSVESRHEHRRPAPGIHARGTLGNRGGARSYAAVRALVRGCARRAPAAAQRHDARHRRHVRKPSARVVLLKGIERGGFVFYTSYRSRKARELEAGGAACLVFIWSELERQVRIEGPVEKVTPAESDAYYASRPLGARLSAWASAQSEKVPSRTILETAMEDARRKYGEAPPRPPHWGGYRVLPGEIEFWQGRADRLHDRLVYRREKDTWKIERLAP
jgi:pyridoxamine 5'-phosphate oxidase